MGRDASRASASSPGWPDWAIRLTSVALIGHFLALLAGALAADPASLLERMVASQFAHYFELIDQGYAYRYYAPEPPPTPIVIARLRFADGRAEQTVRLPDRSLLPRLRYQRHLALAHALAEDEQVARQEGRPSRWAESYARHLCRLYHCAGATLLVQWHRIPNPEELQAALTGGRAARIDLDAEEFFTAPERIGDYSCDAF